MSEVTGSITCWINLFQQGDGLAARELWEVYAEQLTSFARQQLAGVSQPEYDESDAVASAFFSAFTSLQNKESPNSMNRNEFGSYVATITARKICRQIARNKTQKRNPIRFKDSKGISSETAIESENSKDQAPDVVAEFADQFRYLMEMLPRDDMRTIVGLKLEGYTNREIASKLERGLSSIERKLKSIREVWESSFQV